MTVNKNILRVDRTDVSAKTNQWPGEMQLLVGDFATKLNEHRFGILCSKTAFWWNKINDVSG